MNIKNQNGFRIICAMAIYVVVKSLINMAVGGFSLSGLLIALAMACAFFIFIKKVNYVLAAVLVLIVLIHLPTNLGHISSHWLYLLEGAVDIVCAAMLVTNNDVKENYSGTVNFN
ncbi:MAG: hypothetical protein IIZ53_07375 [Ruminococcus sp.]|nr:hypothetical protein [Ruminococcus sp.]